eukprot:m.28225 g.28225  ORF g.28225 m.28225 type:complete len:197 (-) comp9026_c0_seq1:359-949(-)
MFRDPRARDHSACLYHGRSGTRQHPSDVHEYIAIHKSCATKMMLGKKCNHPSEEDWGWLPSQTELQQALANLERFEFVGLTDYWIESICLFHAMFGRNITKHELDNVRPGAKQQVNHRDGTQQHFVHPGLQEVGVDEDPADYELFQVAKRIFTTNLVKYGIRVPSSLIDSRSENAPSISELNDDADDDDADADDVR